MIDLVIGAAIYVRDAFMEKVDLVRNPRRFVEEIKGIAKKEGLAFACYALAIELIEDVVLPTVFAFTGHPELIPAALAFHTEPVMYPLWFGARKMIRMMQGGVV